VSWLTNPILSSGVMTHKSSRKRFHENNSSFRLSFGSLPFDSSAIVTGHGTPDHIMYRRFRDSLDVGSVPVLTEGQRTPGLNGVTNVRVDQPQEL
jgi:hypothetical protein